MTQTPLSLTGLGKPTSTNEREIDFDNQPWRTPFDILSDPDADYDEEYDGANGERLLNYTEVDQNTDSSYHPRRIEIPDNDDDYISKKTKETERTEYQHPVSVRTLDRKQIQSVHVQTRLAEGYLFLIFYLCH